MKKILAGKTVLITGTAKGIGYTMVEVFSEMGATVIAHARVKTEETENNLAEISKKYGNEIIPIYFDLTDEVAIKEGVKEIRSLKIRIDGLVNNAGIGSNSLFQMTRMEELREVFEADFFGPFYLTQFISKIMVRQGGGSIVNISSTSALDGNSGKSAYGSAKAALLTFTRSVAEELGVAGIRCNAICPGVVNTPSIKMMPDYVIDIERESTYLGKLADTADVANTAAYLISDYSSYITGQVIRVDGGKTVYEKRKV